MRRRRKPHGRAEEAALAEEGGAHAPDPADGGATDADAARDADAGSGAPPASPAPAAEGESAAELRDKWLRSVAEADNVRKRAAADVREARQYGSSAVLHELLPVLDNLQRALADPPAGLDPPFLDGLRLIEQQWATVLQRHGVRPVPAEPGQPFDPAVHRVLLETESAEHPPGTIVSEVVRGYRLHDRLLREGQVVVARAPSPPAGGADGGAGDGPPDAGAPGN